MERITRGGWWLSPSSPPCVSSLSSEIPWYVLGVVVIDLEFRLRAAMLHVLNQVF